MNRMIKMFVLVVLTVFMSCNNKEQNNHFKSGDILFRGRLNSSLSQAIDAVTQTGNDHHYTHMGVVEVKNDTIWVLHAAPVKGVCKELLSEFCQNDNDSIVIGHYRIKDISAESIESALLIANKELGQTYNFSYILEDEGYYCSEYIYEIFARDSVFQLNPMTFIDPESGTFHSGWVKHYRDLGIDIPEGQPGCNPNGMATSDRLYFLGFVNQLVEQE